MKEFHPFAAVVPMLTGSEFDDFATNIAANGLLVPILLYQGKILDGRNRERGCIEAGVEPRYEDAGDITDEEAIDKMIALNIRRRQLSVAQRAFAGARLANIKIQGRPKKIPGNLLFSFAKAAKIVGSSEGSVQRANKVIENAPELEAKIYAGEIALKTAAEQVQPPRKREPSKPEPRVKPAPKPTLVLVPKAEPPTPVQEPFPMSPMPPPEKPKPSQPLPRAATVPVVDMSKRRVLTPEMVDPEFKGSSIEFINKYGHVQMETAEERATNRFASWAIHLSGWAKVYKKNYLLECDPHWLRSPKKRDVERFREAYSTLAMVFENAKLLLDTAEAALKNKEQEDKEK